MNTSWIYLWYHLRPELKYKHMEDLVRSVMLDRLLGTLFLSVSRIMHCICLTLGTSSNMSTSRPTCTPSVFKVFTVNPLYTDLLICLLWLWIHWSACVICVFQIPQHKHGSEPKPFGYPVDITPLAVLSSCRPNKVQIAWSCAVDRVTRPLLCVVSIWYSSFLIVSKPKPLCAEPLTKLTLLICCDWLSKSSHNLLLCN